MSEKKGNAGKGMVAKKTFKSIDQKKSMRELPLKESKGKKHNNGENGTHKKAKHQRVRAVKKPANLEGKVLIGIRPRDHGQRKNRGKRNDRNGFGGVGGGK